MSLRARWVDLRSHLPILTTAAEAKITGVAWVTITFVFLFCTAKKSSKVKSADANNKVLARREYLCRLTMTFFVTCSKASVVAVTRMRKTNITTFIIYCRYLAHHKRKKMIFINDNIVFAVRIMYVCTY